MIRLIAIAALILAVSASPARAEPITIFLLGAAFAATTAGAVVTFAITTAISVGVSFAAQKFLAPKGVKQGLLSPDQAGPVGGVELDIRADAAIPQSLIFGRAVTAGSLVYAETYGVRGDIDNSDLIEIIALADHPCTELREAYVAEQKVNPQAEDGGRGFPVSGYENKLAYRFFNGSDSDPDSFARDKLGSHSDRPYLASMVGRGRAYAHIHYTYDPELVPGRLPWRFVLDGLKLYDPRKDSTSGGSGSHRWNSLDTHGFSRNLALIAYNILRGVRVRAADASLQTIYGPGVAAAQLPNDVWFAAMNECDLVLTGETDGQFWGGAEVPVNSEPMEAIKSILQACDGRLVEIGGVYKLYVGPPGLPVLSITDGDLRADEGDVFRPILPLEQRINHVTGAYTRPSDGWLPRVAPPRFDTIAELRDGRRVTADLDLPWVQSPKQMQRLQKQVLAKAQRERRHRIPLGAPAWGLEPGDVIEWTSERNGYIDKLFVIDALEDDHAFNTVISMTEADPDDYDWTPETDLIAEADGSLTVIRPAAKEIGNFAVAGIAHPGTNGTSRPAIRLTWDDPLDGDIVAVEVEYRSVAQPNDVAHDRADDPTAEQMIILGGVQPNTEYEVRAQFVSFGGWRTARTLWIAVVTPDVGITPAELDALTRARLSRLDDDADAAIQRRLDAIFAGQDSIAHLALGMFGQMDRQAQRYQIAAGARITRVDEAVATETEARVSAITALDAAVFDPETGLPAVAGVVDGLVAEVGYDPVTGISALATAFNTVFASGANGDAAAMVRLIAQDAPEGLAAQIALEVKTEGGVYGTDSAALKLGVVTGLGSVIEAIADRFLFRKADGLFPLLDISGNTVLLDGNITINGFAKIIGNMSANRLTVNTLTADRIISGEVSKSSTGASASDSNGANFNSVISIGGVVIDARVSGLFIFGQMPGKLTAQPQQYVTTVGSVKIGNQTLTSCRIGFFNGTPSGGAPVAQDIPLVFADFVPRNQLSNGTFTVELAISGADYSWAFQGRLTVLALRA